MTPDQDTLDKARARLEDLAPVQAQFLKANISDAYAEADRSPIAIVKRGVRTHVLMSAEHYRALLSEKPS
jgi:prevent-host-death family protein